MGFLRLKPGYFIPTDNEWVKAAYYDPTLNSGTGGYWTYATKNNIAPTPVTANPIGDGSAGNTGNFANYNQTVSWGGATQGNVTTVGTNGGPSYYGTYDQSGNVGEIVDTRSPIFPTDLVIRGGNFFWPSSELAISSTLRIGNQPVAADSNDSVGLRIVTISNILSLPNFVAIDNVGNSAHASTSRGRVDYVYQIGVYPVTNLEYAEFLNAVAKTDTYALYSTLMAATPKAGISRSGSNGNYTYTLKSNMANKPVVYISWLRAARYCNWLTNGKPTGNQDATTTETGVYSLRGSTTELFPRSNYKIRTVSGMPKVKV